jgi:hypothetical protein
MANQDVQTKMITCLVKKTEPKVLAKVTLSHPKSGGWSIFLDGVFKKGGNDPAEVNLGSGASVLGKMLEVSCVMKQVAPKPPSMKLSVDTAGVSDFVAADIDPGHSARYSIFVAFLEAP